MMNTVLHGDCLELMKDIPDGSIDMILCDLPYGTTACKWDTIIPFNKLWEQYERIVKPNGAIVLTASQPFTSALVMSNTNLFRYCWVWDKVNKYTMYQHANIMPLKRHEDIAVFYKKTPTYNKQYRDGLPFIAKRTKANGDTNHHDSKERFDTVNKGKHNPCSILPIKGDNKLENGLHPTQKPVELMEYLIKTYTNEGDTVLDNCMGSGTTGVACRNLNRYFIGIEKDEKYFAIAEKRII